MFLMPQDVLSVSKGLRNQLPLTPSRYQNKPIWALAMKIFEFFSQTHVVGRVLIIANFAFPYICSISPHVHLLMLLSLKLEIKGFIRITFQGCTENERGFPYHFFGANQ